MQMASGLRALRGFSNQGLKIYTGAIRALAELFTGIHQNAAPDRRFVY